MHLHKKTAGIPIMRMSRIENMQIKCDKLSANPGQWAGHDIELSDLLTPAFLSTQTGFVDMQAFFAGSGFLIETEEDFAAVQDGHWHAFIRAISGFADWRSMLKAAFAEWIKRQPDQNRQ